MLRVSMFMAQPAPIGSREACSDRNWRSTTMSDSKNWRALVGIDLDTKPGAYPLRLARNGGATAATQTMRIVPKEFRVRRLRVPGGFVDPLPEALKQIADDRVLLAKAFAHVMPRRWSGAFLCCPLTDTQPATSVRAATTTVSDARPTRVLISSAKPVRRFARPITDRSSSLHRCTSRATRS